MTANAIEIMLANAARQGAEIAAREITDRANQAIEQIVDQINADPRLPDLPTVELHPPTIVVEVPAEPVDVKTDAISRAGRSFLGGIIVTALGTVATEIGKLVTSGAFDPLDGSAWKTAGVGLLGALGYAGVAFVQRFISTPRP